MRPTPHASRWWSGCWASLSRSGRRGGRRERVRASRWRRFRGLGAMAAIIVCRGVTKIYRQGAVDVPALRGVDLDVEAGDFATLSGPSGSGKTTLLSLIGGLDRPTAGLITVDGAAISDMAPARLAD